MIENLEIIKNFPKFKKRYRMNCCQTLKRIIGNTNPKKTKCIILKKKIKRAIELLGQTLTDLVKKPKCWA